MDGWMEGGQVGQAGGRVCECGCGCGRPRSAGSTEHETGEFALGLLPPAVSVHLQMFLLTHPGRFSVEWMRLGEGRMSKVFPSEEYLTGSGKKGTEREK
jgi:hypothetical protein